MTEELNNEFYRLLSNDKFRIGCKNPIPMKFVLDNLTVPVTECTDHLGYCNGWTQYRNDLIKLIVSGGIVGKIEYLEYLQYGKNLQNPYNNFVNPFYIFDLLTDEAKKFFVEYYIDDIESIHTQTLNEISRLQQQLENKRRKFAVVSNEVDRLKSITNQERNLK